MQNTNRNDKLYIRTYREIRKYIVQNNLHPLATITKVMHPTEQKLCETLGVSRNVLRESIKSMELMGMVRACPGKGTEVQAFNLDFILQNVLFFQVGPQEEHSIREMFGVRKVLELGVDLLQGYCLARPAAVPPPLSKEAADIIHRMKRC